MDEMFEEFVNTGYYDKCKSTLPDHLKPIFEHWDDNSWKIYIWNYVKICTNQRKASSGKNRTST